MSQAKTTPALRDASAAPVKASASGRVPVSDNDAETCVLSACLLDAGAYALCLPILGEGRWFYSPANRRIWQTIGALVEDGTPVDAQTVASRLRALNRLAECGGFAYLAAIVDAVPHVANVEAYARTVAELGRQRDLVALCQRVAAEGYERHERPDEWVDEKLRELGEAADGRPDDEETSRIGDLAREVFEDVKSPTTKAAVASGLADLDRKTGGLPRGAAIVVAGRPGMGKSSAVLGSALHVAAHGGRVAFFSAESPKWQVTQRAKSALSGVTVDAWQRRLVRLEEIVEATQLLQSYDLHVFDKQKSIDAVLAKVSKLHREKPLDLIVADYAQKFRVGPGSRARNREQEVSEISAFFSAIAIDFDVPVLLVSQLNRDVDDRQPPMPILSDLRESGALENDAFQVLFFYRELYYKQPPPEDGDTSGPAQIIVAKNKNGPTGIVDTYFHAKTCVFRDLYPNERPY